MLGGSIAMLVRRHIWPGRVALAALIGLALALAAPRSALACMCPPPPGVLNALNDSDSVFLGTVVEVRDPQPTLRLTPSFPFVLYDTPSYAPRRITIAVARVWRGPPYRRIVVTSGQVYASCGVPFREGDAYLVYAFVNGAGDLTTHRCSRTATASAGRTDMYEFGPGMEPSLAWPEQQRPPILAGVACMLLLLMLAGAGYWRWSGRRANKAHRPPGGAL